MRDRAPSGDVEWAASARPRRGEAVSGDLGFVTTVPGGSLVAAVDGVGHGREAARAARTAATVVRATPDADLVALVQRCHEALRGTRGAAVSVAFLSHADATLRWLGVGTVEGRLLAGRAGDTGRDRSLRLVRGLPGHVLPRLTVTTLPLRRGDLVVLATDGVAGQFADALEVAGSAEAIAQRILARHCDGSDDALAVVARWLPTAPERR